MLHPDDREEGAEAHRRVLEGGDPLDLDSRLKVAPGRPARWVRTRGQVFRDAEGNVVRLSGTVQDITETKESEQGLAFLSAMAGAANEAQTLAEALVASDTVVRPFTQWPAVVVSAPDPDQAGELVHFDSHWGDFTEPERTSGRALAERVAVERRVIQEPGPDGTFLVGGPAQVGDRLACVVVSDSRASSEPRASELAIFTQMLALLAHVAEREEAATALAVARDDALSASRAKSEFLATMSHEIRTPLNGVIGLSELLNRTDLTSHQRRLAQGVDQAGRSLLALVNDILDLSKIEAGRLDLEEVDFDPRAVVEQSAALLAERASAKDLELVVSSAEQMPSMVCGDPVRFGQVITNLVANAVKFTQSGEVVVRATGTGSDGVRVEVRDTGIGIPPEVQRQLFAAFSQADSSTTREYGGTGLGLAISKRIVDATGGTIGVDSEVDTGSTFWFTIPFAPADTHSRSSEDALEAAVAGLRILVVDDNATNRFILGEQLESWSVSVTAVESVYDALVELDASVRHDEPYDVALLDYMMPGADGERLARIIRAEERHRDLRLALLSSATEPTTEWLADVGFDVFLGKPVLRSRLLETLASLARPGQAVRIEPEVAAPDSEGGRGRLLVVEDNPVNQLVATGILRSLGYDLVIAENGAAGVAALADDPTGFDAILMDCQMPVMDGFDATRAIRAIGGVGARSPIIAMTASATAEERERCREAGMDDFLSKPVVSELLATTLDRWVPVAGRLPDPHGDPSALRLRELVNDDGFDPALVLTIVDRFGRSASETLAALAAAAAAGDAGAVADGAHRLRGSASNLGLADLAERSTAVEGEGRAGAVPDDAALADLGAALAAAITQLDAASTWLR
jgi:hypothetical protein